MPTLDDPPSRILRLLLVEDSAPDAELVCDLLELSHGHRVGVRWVQTLSAARLALGDSPDCLLLDLGLPDARGLEGVHALRLQSPGIPIVVLTGRDDGELAARAVATGAQHCVTKGTLDGDGMVRAARHAIERQRTQGLIGRRVSEEAVAGLGERALPLERLEPARTPKAGAWSS